MTLPAQSPPDASQTDGETNTNEEASASPVALIAVVGVSALVIILCVLGAAFSGLFDLFGGAGSTAESVPSDVVAASNAGPAISFDDGQYLVQRDVLPGTYQTTVPPGSPGCTWERRSTTDGTASSVLESGEGDVGAQLVVNIKETDKIFHSQSCGTWQRTDD